LKNSKEKKEKEKIIFRGYYCLGKKRKNETSGSYTKIRYALYTCGPLYRNLKIRRSENKMKFTIGSIFIGR